MKLKYDHTLLLVDDEASILKALKRLFRRDGYQILTAECGQQALDLLRQMENPVSLIISDQRMPGMNGATFLEQSMDCCPDAVRFLLTGYSDIDAVVDAVNKGNIHKYLAKPWNDSEILLLVREALSQVELRLENIRLTELTRRQNQELADLNKSLEEKVNERTWALKYQNKKLHQLNNGLEKSLMETIRLLLSLVESSNPKLGSYMKAVGQLARKIAATAGLDETIQNRVEMAGLVHDIGLMGMPEAILEKDERSMSTDEFEAYTHHPEIAALSLSSVEGLREISEIVGAHHENLDGSGFPRRIMGDDLSTDARILAVAADYCTVLHLWPIGVKRVLYVARRYMSHATLSAIEIAEEMVVRKAIAEKVIIEGAGKRYDGVIVRHFLKSIGSDPTKKTINQLPFNLLRKGMVLMEDLRLKDGRLLLTRGTTLGDGALQSIMTIGNRGMIEDTIAVTKESGLQTEREDTP
ncbi:HD domain-containing phosphohydrolase [uncultured Desulfosarcina sp.]|uniref:HD domain-containing phosphohydrolase n=1 Tax=uncultured Desulfosarcina sp. TaxID=218289 RepID=UPI0029C7BDEF|nr:HD domain-containing phosphohydrolase [uncultured Desulfosarcina sp.]